MPFINLFYTQKLLELLRDLLKVITLGNYTGGMLYTILFSANGIPAKRNPPRAEIKLRRRAVC
jgi:hypothetical protein